jgi:hypothetical protein
VLNLVSDPARADAALWPAEEAFAMQTITETTTHIGQDALLLAISVFRTPLDVFEFVCNRHLSLWNFKRVVCAYNHLFEKQPFFFFSNNHRGVLFDAEVKMRKYSCQGSCFTY